MGDSSSLHISLPATSPPPIYLGPTAQRPIQVQVTSRSPLLPALPSHVPSTAPPRLTALWPHGHCWGHMDIVGVSGPLHSLDPMPGHLPSALVRVDTSFSSIVCSHSSYPHLSPHSPLLQSLHWETQHNALIAGTGAPQGRAPWGLFGSISLCLLVINTC